MKIEIKNPQNSEETVLREYVIGTERLTIISHGCPFYFVHAEHCH